MSRTLVSISRNRPVLTKALETSSSEAIKKPKPQNQIRQLCSQMKKEGKKEGRQKRNKLGLSTRTQPPFHAKCSSQPLTSTSPFNAHYILRAGTCYPAAREEGAEVGPQPGSLRRLGCQPRCYVTGVRVHF